MGGIFDINHRLHGAAFAIGVPSLTLAAILVTLALRRGGVDIAMWPAHLSWVSFVLMAATMVLFVMSLQTRVVAKRPPMTRKRSPRHHRHPDSARGRVCRSVAVRHAPRCRSGRHQSRRRAHRPSYPMPLPGGSQHWGVCATAARRPSLWYASQNAQSGQ